MSVYVPPVLPYGLRAKGRGGGLFVLKSNDFSLQKQSGSSTFINNKGSLLEVTLSNTAPDFAEFGFYVFDASAGFRITAPPGVLFHTNNNLDNPRVEYIESVTPISFVRIMSISGNWYELEGYGEWTPGFATAVDADDWTQGMIFDLNAEDLTLDNDAAVSSWSSSFGEMVFTQSDAAKQPVFKTSVSGSNGKKAVSFDAIDDAFVGPAFPSALTALTLASVIIPRTTNQNVRVFNGHGSRNFFLHNSRSNYCFNEGYISEGITAAAQNVPSVAMVTLSGTEGRAYRNNVDVTTNAAYGSLLSRVHIGPAQGSNHTSEPVGADALRLIGWNRVLSASTMASFQAAMNEDYAIR